MAVRRERPFPGVFPHPAKPLWLRNEIYANVEALLRLNPGVSEAELARPSKDLPYSVHSLYILREDGGTDWSRSFRFDEREDLDRTEDARRLRRVFTGAAPPFRGPAPYENISIDEALQSVRTDPFWAITLRSGMLPDSSRPLRIYEFTLFGVIPGRHLGRRARDPISTKLASRYPAVDDLAFYRVFPSHGGYLGQVLIREIKLLVLDLENIGSLPVRLTGLAQRHLVAENALHLRRVSDVNTELQLIKATHRKLPIEMLKPGEHLFIPLQVQLGLSRKPRGDPGRSYEMTVEETDVPVPWRGYYWPQLEVRLQISRGIERGRDMSREIVSEEMIPTETLRSKPDFEQIIEKDYILGDVVDVGEVLGVTASGAEARRKLRIFDPKNLLLHGSFERGSCPILYADVGGTWHRLGPILVDAVGPAHAREERVRIPAAARRILLREEEEE